VHFGRCVKCIWLYLVKYIGAILMLFGGILVDMWGVFGGILGDMLGLFGGIFGHISEDMLGVFGNILGPSTTT